MRLSGITVLLLSAHGVRVQSGYATPEGRRPLANAVFTMRAYPQTRCHRTSGSLLIDAERPTQPDLSGDLYLDDLPDAHFRQRRRRCRLRIRTARATPYVELRDR